MSTLYQNKKGSLDREREAKIFIFNPTQAALYGENYLISSSSALKSTGSSSAAM